MFATYMACSAGIVASNFIYQAMCNVPDWGAATERSFFQIVALAAVGLALIVRGIE